LASLGEQAQPEGRIAWILRAYERHGEVDRGEVGAADRSGRHRATVEVEPFDEEVRHPCVVSEHPELLPEPARYKVEMEPAHCLALHDRSTTDEVIAKPQPPDLDVNTLPGKERGNSGAFLADVGNDAHALWSLAAARLDDCNKAVRLSPLLALSRSESA
jgi:hypothetical protein